LSFFIRHEIELDMRDRGDVCRSQKEGGDRENDIAVCMTDEHAYCRLM